MSTSMGLLDQELFMIALHGHMSSYFNVTKRKNLHWFSSLTFKEPLTRSCHDFTNRKQKGFGPK